MENEQYQQNQQNLQAQETITLEEITNETEKQPNIKNITLEDSGIKVEMDKTKLNGHLLMKARELQGNSIENVSLSVYLASLVCKFDGECKTPTEILDMSVLDVFQLESIILEKKSN